MILQSTVKGCCWALCMQLLSQPECENWSRAELVSVSLDSSIAGKEPVAFPLDSPVPKNHASAGAFNCPAVLQETVKGSQGAGRVDESLDSSIAGNEPVAEPSKPKGPARPPGAKGKKKGKR